MNILKNLPEKINWFPGHMRKTLRLIQQQTSKVDIFVQIRDARLPYSSRNSEFDQIIKKAKKQKLIIFNKFDLCDPIKTNKIIEDYNSYGIPCITVSTHTHDDMRKLLGLLKEKYQRKYKQIGLWMMICGMPNVGKSSLINQIRNISDLQNKRAAAKTSASVCTTRGLHGLKILQSPLMWLVDSPGVMVPSIIPPQAGLKMALLGLIKQQIVDKFVLIQFILEYFEEKQNDKYYTGLKISKPCSAYKYKFYDYDGGLDFIIDALREGKMGKITFDDPIYLDK